MLRGVEGSQGERKKRSGRLRVQDVERLYQDLLRSKYVSAIMQPSKNVDFLGMAHLDRSRQIRHWSQLFAVV